jgi:hypothetical protein
MGYVTKHIYSRDRGRVILAAGTHELRRPGYPPVYGKFAVVCGPADDPAARDLAERIVAECNSGGKFFRDWTPFHAIEYDLGNGNWGLFTAVREETGEEVAACLSHNNDAGSLCSELQALLKHLGI